MDFDFIDNRRQKKKIITPSTTEHDLFTSIVRGDVPKVKTLIQSGVDPNCTVEGWNPLTTACELDKEEILEVLIEALQNQVQYIILLESTCIYTQCTCTCMFIILLNCKQFTII